MAVIDGKWLSKEGLTYFWSKIKSIFTKQTETNAIANLGAKNMLYISNSSGYTATNHGRTFTVLSDGGIKITGTSSDNSNADFYVIGSWGNRNILLNENKDSCLIRMACDTNYGYSQIRLRVMNRSTGSTVNETGVETNKDVQLSHVVTTVFVSVFPSVTLPEDGIVVYPMIRRAAITDDTFVPYAKTNADLTNENENQQLEIDYAINTGAKNLFNINAVQTANHVTSSLSDGVLTVTSSGNWAHYSVPVNLPAGDYIFTTTISNFSRASGAAATSVRMRIATSTSGGTAPALVTVSGNGPLEIPFTWAGGQLYVQYYPNYSATTTYVGSFTASNSMIRRAEITDDTFQPYAPTNRELYETKTEQTETNVIANFGAKNLLKDVRTTTTHRGITFTVNEDGSVTASGTNDGTGASLLNINTQSSLALDNGEYILSGCPAGGSASGYLMDITRSSGASIKDTGDGINFTVGGDYTINEIRIVISRTVTVDNLTFYPMIRRAEITDATFQPYAPTNRELYETRFASKTILPNNVDLNDLKTGGIYNGVNSTGNSAVHMPVATGSFNFVLTVIEANESIIQIFKQLNSAGDPNLYIRRFYIYNSDWDGWYQFTGTQV